LNIVMVDLGSVEHGETTVESKKGEISIRCGQGLLEVDKCSPYINNPKEHPEDQVKRLADQIVKHGWDQQIVVDGNLEVVIGHGRLKAAKQLGMDKVPVAVRDDFTKLDASERRIADNRLSETPMDESREVEELEKLVESSEHDELMVGMDEDKVSELLDKMTDEEELEEPEAENPDNVETDIQEGEVFKLGRHRLMCGDSTDEDHVEVLMDDQKINLILTDPPYGIDLNTDFSSMESKFKGKEGGNKHKKVIDDNNKFDYRQFEYLDVDEQFWWGANYYAKTLPEGGSWYVWDKRLDDSADKMYGSCFELCWSKQKHKQDILRHKWAGIFGIEKEDTDERVHPTQKPVDLSADLIKRHSTQDDIVLDLFGGSGSTLLAAEQTNRKCFMMELDTQYCQVIIDRWEELTGKEHEVVKQIES
jgi:DNA modification methylase